MSWQLAADPYSSVDLSNPGQLDRSTSNTTKLILIWTNLDKNAAKVWLNPENMTLHKPQCEYQDCDVTADRSRIQEATVVALKDRDRSLEGGGGWPEYRSPHQLYVHMLGERPGPWHEYIRYYNNRINLTMSSRKSADITFTNQLLLEQTTVTSRRYQPRVPLSSRTRMAVWPVSHCNTDSARDEYVKKLSRYISVDIYGECGNLSCPRNNWRYCLGQWERKYKFYLAFENAICEDYITEKYYRPVNYEIIPVILSGTINIPMPPHSAIHVADFKSPRDLARFLVDLGNNEEDYVDYFQWKQNYYFQHDIHSVVCKLCKAAHTVKHKPALSDYYGWWFAGCDNDFIPRLRTEGGW